MLIIPAVPSGLYLAEGLVMTSTCLISSAGIISSMSAWLSAVSPDAFPLIQTVTLEFPRNETDPSLSTSTDGILASKSLADPPSDAISCVASKTFLSSSNLIWGFFATISTSPNWLASSSRVSSPRLRV